MHRLGGALVGAMALVVTFMSVVGAADGAAGLSPLDRPVDDLKEIIARRAECTWMALDGLTSCRTPEKERVYWIKMDFAPDGSLDFIEFLPDLGYPDGPPLYEGVREVNEDRVAVMDMISQIFPAWTNSRAWLKKVLHRAAYKRYFQASIRVGDTSIYVGEFQSADSDTHRANVVLTKKKDLREFKSFPCLDDEQGRGLDNCTDRDGPPPPENPILHLK